MHAANLTACNWTKLHSKKLICNSDFYLLPANLAAPCARAEAYRRQSETLENAMAPEKTKKSKNQEWNLFICWSPPLSAHSIIVVPIVNVITEWNAYEWVRVTRSEYCKVQPNQRIHRTWEWERKRERKGYRTDLHRFPPPPDSCSEKVHHITEEYQFFTEWTNGANEQKAKKPLVWTHSTRNEFRAIGASETQPTTFSVDVIARDDETTCLRPGMRQT